jgi:DNA-binding transcriptional ArsR family regulator
MKQEAVSLGKNINSELERVLKALANRRRLMILVYLKSKKEATVGEIAHFISLSFKSTSKHLTILRAANLVEKDQQGLEVYYRLLDPLPSSAKSILNLL